FRPALDVDHLDHGLMIIDGEGHKEGEPQRARRPRRDKVTKFPFVLFLFVRFVTFVASPASRGGTRPTYVRSRRNPPHVRRPGAAVRTHFIALRTRRAIVK